MAQEPLGQHLPDKACIAIYGVLAYSVVRRTNEICIRMALGAKRWQVLRMMLREAATLALLGVVIGVPVALAAGRFYRARFTPETLGSGDHCILGGDSPRRCRRCRVLARLPSLAGRSDGGAEI